MVKHVSDRFLFVINYLRKYALVTALFLMIPIPRDYAKFPIFNEFLASDRVENDIKWSIKFQHKSFIRNTQNITHQIYLLGFFLRRKWKLYQLFSSFSCLTLLSLSREINCFSTKNRNRPVFWSYRSIKKRSTNI